MTAEPVKAAHRWPVPPQDGYTVDDLFTLPDLPPHTELIDGSLVFVSPQRAFHSKVIDLLVSGLRGTAPPDMKVEREMTVLLDTRNGPEPDISVVRAEAVTGLEQTRFRQDLGSATGDRVADDESLCGTVRDDGVGAVRHPVLVGVGGLLAVGAGQQGDGALAVEVVDQDVQLDPGAGVLTALADTVALGVAVSG